MSTTTDTPVSEWIDDLYPITSQPVMRTRRALPGAISYLQIEQQRDGKAQIVGLTRKQLQAALDILNTLGE